jgi:hypothetical protein
VECAEWVGWEDMERERLPSRIPVIVHPLMNRF